MNQVIKACLVVSALASTNVSAATKFNINEMHNPQFDVPLHEPVMQPETESENHPRFRPAKFDVLHYDIDVNVDPELGTIQGSVGVVIKSLVQGLKEVDLDAIDMQIESVSDGSLVLAHRYDGTIVTAALSSPLNTGESTFVRIKYKSLLPQTLHLAKGDVTNPHRMKTAYTYTEPEGSSAWYPCFDRPADKATMTIRVVVPEGYNALSNGDLLSVDNEPGKNSFYYRMEYPIATYLVSLAIGNYEVLDIGSFRQKPVTLWAPPSLREAALTETARTPEMMQVFSDFTGVAYPYNSYATSVAQGFRSSMEHQSATTMGSWRITGDGSGEGVVAHELAHQWFGDWVTCRTWGELWLNEGYASYLPYVFFNATADEVRAIGQIDYWRSGYFEEAATSVHALSQANPDVDNIFDSHAYEKSALTIHLMRWMANRSGAQSPADGEEVYTKVLRKYLTAKGGSTVTNYDHEKALSEVTGQNWEVFFDQFVRSEGHPVLGVAATTVANKVTLRIEQSQFTRAERKWRTFTFPLEVELILADGSSEIKTIDIYDSIQTFEIEGSSEVIGINLDPNLVVPAEITTNLDAANWQNVLRSSKLTTSRLQAMRKLIERQNYLADSVFTDLVVADPSEYVRASAISELTAKIENRSAVMDIYRSLLSRGPENVATKGSIARAEEWLVSTIGRIPTRDEERSWQSRFINSDIVAERKSLLAMLAVASMDRAQTFAIERLGEGNWVMQDRWTLVNLLSMKPSTTAAKPFVIDALKDSSMLYLRQIIANLTAAKFDDVDAVDDVINIAKDHRSFNLREYAVKLLAKQTTSVLKVCPELKTLSESPVATPDMRAGIRSAAAAALTELNCPAN